MKKKYNLKARLVLAVTCLVMGFGAMAQVDVVASGGTPAASYTTLGAAFAAINAGTHTGNIGIGISANTTEAGPCVLNSSGAGAASYTAIGIAPTVDGVSISGATATGRGLIELNGADNVTIDGDNAGTAGVNRNLTITNTAASTVTYTSVIRVALSTLVTSANSNVIRNCNIFGSATGRNIAAATSTTGSEHTTYGILVGGGASTVAVTTAPSAISSVSTTIGSPITATAFTVSNNSIDACARGISVNGSATTVANSLTVTGNIIGNATPGNTTTVYSRGISLQGFDNTLVSGNTVQNMEWYVGTSQQGIALGEVSASGTNAVVENNKVNGVSNKNTGTFGAYGINLAAGANNIVRNNMIQGITGDMTGGGAFSTTFGIIGIRVGTGTGHKIYNNSVNLYGLRSGTATASLLTTALAVVGTGQTGCDIRNNIFSNTMTGGTTSIANVDLFLPSGATSAMALTLNNNAYYSGSDAARQGIAQVGTTAGTGFYLASNFVAGATAPATNLRSYTSTLSAAGTNDNASYASVNAAPFVSATDLHINTASAELSNIEQKGDASVPVTNDIDGDIRPNAPTTIPDMGADEVIAPGCVSANGGTITPATLNKCVGQTVSLSSTGASSGTGISYQWMVSTTSGSGYVNVTGGAGANTTSYTTGALTAGVYYYVLQTTCTNGPATGLSNEVTVTVNTNPTVTVSPTTASICQPGATAIALTAGGASTFTWGPAAGLSATTGPSVNALPSGTTTYTVTGTDANGCTATATSAITVSEIPSISSVTATPSSVCSGANSQLVATAGTTSSYALSSTAFSTNACLANAGPTGDDAIQGGNLIGFNFTFFGVSYDKFAISTNGNIQLGDGTGSAGNPAYSNAWTDAAIPTAAVPNNLVALAWDDWSIAAGEITWGTSGVAPNRKLIVCFNTMGRGAGSADTLNGQIVLEETTNRIILNITKKGVSANTATQGIENQTGAAGMAVTGRNNVAWSAINNTQVFSPAGGPPTYSWSPATFLSSTTIANPMANAVTSTTTYTVTASNGACSSTSSITITAGSALTSTSNTTPASGIVCAGSNVTLNSLPAGGGAPYTYSWTGPNSFASTAQNPVITGATPAATGTYTIVVTDNCGATSTSTVNVIVNPNPVVTVSPTSATFCSGGPAVALTAGGATSFTWLPTAGLSAATGTSVNASPSTTTTYTVTGTDGNGCIASATAAITRTETPAISAVTATPSTLCSGGNSQLQVTAGLTTAYTVSSIPFAAIATPGSGVTTLANAGTIVTTISSGTLDDGGWINQSIPFNFNFFGTGYNSFAVSTNGFIFLGTGAPATFQGYSNTFPSTGAARPAIGPLYSDLDFRTAGVINYFTTGVAPNRKLVINWSSGMFYNAVGSLTTQLVLNENGSIEMHTTNSTGTNAAVQGIQNAAGTTAFTVAGRNNVTWTVATPNAYMFSPSGGSPTYSWSPATFLSSTTIANPMANAITSTTTYTVSADNAGCAATATVTVNVNPIPTAPTAAGATICSGTTATLNATGTGVIGWYSAATGGTYLGGGSSFVTPALTSNATYFVQDSSLAGCTSSRTSVAVVVNSLPVVTANASATSICIGNSVTLTGGGATSYLWDNGVTDGLAFTPAVGTVTYNVTGTDGNGCMNTASVAVTVNALPTVTVMAMPAAVCEGGSTTLMGMGASTYTWTGGVSDGVSFTPVSTNTYTVTGTDANGCSNTATQTVTVNPLPTVGANTTAATVCSGASVTLTGSGATSYTWTGSVSDGVSFNPTSTDTYTVTGTDGNGCMNTASVTVTVNSLPSVSVMAMPATVCEGGSTTLMGMGASSYTWTGGITDGVSFTPVATDTYTVTGTDGNGCSNTATQTVTVNTLPTVVANSTASAICDGSPVTLTGSGATSYTWTGSVTDGVAFTPSATDTYTVTGTDANGCMNTATTTVTVNSLPSVSMTPFTVPVCDNTTAFTLTNGSPAGGVYSGTSVTGGMFDPTAAGAGMYVITYTITDGNSCSNSDTASITVDICNGIAANTSDFEGISVYPNPASDVVNITVSNANFSTLTISIVDIQGKEVYSATDKNIPSGYNRQVNIEGFAKGVYYIKMTTGTDSKVQKLIVH